MPNAMRLLWLLLAVLALRGVAGQNYWLYSGQAGAQFTFNCVRWSEAANETGIGFRNERDAQFVPGK
jgi:hypothetical protein